MTSYFKIRFEPCNDQNIAMSKKQALKQTHGDIFRSPANMAEHHKQERVDTEGIDTIPREKHFIPKSSFQ